MPIRHYCLLLIVLLLPPAGFAAEPDFERGIMALEMGNPARTLELWQPLAEDGYPNAQFGLGMLYSQGAGVPQDFEEAAYWYLLAADQGFAPAQFHLGNAYMRGLGVTLDPARAVHWWRKAAEQHLGQAQFNLGQALWEGDGIEPDRDRARYWFRLAQTNGIPVEERYLQSTTDDQPVASSAANSCADWLKQLPAGGYTLQLVAGHRLNSVTDFERQFRLTSPYAICAYRERNSDWFGLFYGHYPDRATASRAIEQLPAAARDNGPYARSLSALRSLILLQPERADQE